MGLALPGTDDKGLIGWLTRMQGRPRMEFPGAERTMLAGLEGTRSRPGTDNLQTPIRPIEADGEGRVGRHLHATGCIGCELQVLTAQSLVSSVPGIDHGG